MENEIVSKFKEGDCVFLSSNPDLKMTIEYIRTKKIMGKPLTEKFPNGKVTCTWIYEGEKKTAEFNQDSLQKCASS